MLLHLMHYPPSAKLRSARDLAAIERATRMAYLSLSLSLARACALSLCRHMTFLKDQAGIYRSVRVAARLGGENFQAQCRCCSYCGSCFSGRFMKPNAMHQQAGGWKEITERTAAGKYSWSSLRGWRLCVPCFTHWASNGTNVNTNRPWYFAFHALSRAHTHTLSRIRTHARDCIILRVGGCIRVLCVECADVVELRSAWVW